MAQLMNLWTTDKHKFTVLDEGIDATYGQHLLIALLQLTKKKNVQNPINLLLFSSPKYYLKKYLQFSEESNVKIQDYFNLNLDEEEIDVFGQLTDFVAKNLNSIIVIDCLGTLALQIGVAKSCRFIEKLSSIHKSEVFCIYRRDFYQVIPRIETLGNIYVKLKKSNKIGFGSNIYYEISVIHKKASGNVVHWNELIQQNIETYDLQSEKIPNNLNLKREINNSQESCIKPAVSFRIEMSEHEIKQRDSVMLPYILPGNSESKCKIFYEPDDEDFDEEDPDDDLDI